MGVECGEWVEDGETVTYPPCPPDPPFLTAPTAGLYNDVLRIRCGALG